MASLFSSIGNTFANATKGIVDKTLNTAVGANAYLNSLNGRQVPATDAQLKAGREWANRDPLRTDSLIRKGTFGGRTGQQQLMSGNFRKSIENETGFKWGTPGFNNALGHNEYNVATHPWSYIPMSNQESKNIESAKATRDAINSSINAIGYAGEKAQMQREAEGWLNPKQQELVDKGYSPDDWVVQRYALGNPYNPTKYTPSEAARQAGMGSEADEQAGMGSEADKQAGMTDSPTASPGSDQAAGTTGDAATHDNEGAGDETYEIAEDVIDKSRGDNPEDWGYRLYEGGQYYYADDPDYAMEYALAKGLVDNYGGKYAGNFTGFQDNGTSDEWKSWVTEYNPQYYGYVYDQYGDPQGNLDWDAYWNDIINYDTSNYNDLASQDDFWTYNLAGSGSAAMDMAAVDYLSGNDILNSDYMWSVNGQNMSGLDDAALQTELQKLGLEDAEKAEELEKIMTEIEDEQAALYLSDLIRQQGELGMSPDQITTGELGLMQSELGPLELTLDDTGALLTTYEPVASAPEYGGTGYVGAYDIADLMSGEYVDPETLAYQSMLSGLDPETLYYRA